MRRGLTSPRPWRVAGMWSDRRCASLAVSGVALGGSRDRAMPVASQPPRTGSSGVERMPEETGGTRGGGGGGVRRRPPPRRRRRASRPRRAGSRRDGSCSPGRAAALPARSNGAAGGGPPALSIACERVTGERDLSRVAPTTSWPSIEAEAWPRAQARTSWPKAVIRPFSSHEIDGHGRAAERRAAASRHLRPRPADRPAGFPRRAPGCAASRA